MDTMILNGSSVDTRLGIEVLLVLTVYVIHDGLPTGGSWKEEAKTR